MSVKSILIGLGVGAGAMYFMDPRYGKRRQAMVRDQFTEMAHDADDLVNEAMRDIRNRARGMVAETYSMLSDQDTSDWLIEQRVRSEIGRYIPYSGSIDVVAHNGVVTLRGPILIQDKAYLMAKVGAIRGVGSVDDQLQAHETPEGVPGLQYEPKGGNGNQGRSNSWSPTARFLGSLGGLGMLAFGSIRGGIFGSSMSLAGIGLVTRSITNKDLGQLVGVSTEPGAVNINKAININVPVEEVYQLWSNFENFPRFMNHIKSVKNSGSGLSHWVAKGPVGSSPEWDAIETQNIPNRVIAWKSTPDSQVKTAGSVRFHQNQMGGTTVNVHMTYTPPAGVVGNIVATIFGDDPKQAMDDDLQRMKSLLEKGKTTKSGSEVSRDQVES